MELPSPLTQESSGLCHYCHAGNPLSWCPARGCFQVGGCLRPPQKAHLPQTRAALRCAIWSFPQAQRKSIWKEKWELEVSIQQGCCKPGCLGCRMGAASSKEKLLGSCSPPHAMETCTLPAPTALLPPPSSSFTGSHPTHRLWWGGKGLSSQLGCQEELISGSSP